MNIGKYDFYYKLKDRMGLKLFESKNLTDSLIKIIIESLENNKEVTIGKFGKFVRVTTNKKELYNPNKKKYIVVPPKEKIKFIPKKNLTDS